MERKSNQGFSLIELIIVVAIMAVLIGTLAPQYIKYVERSRTVTDEDVAKELWQACIIIASDDDYIDNINSGDKVEFSAAGVTLTPAGSSVEDGLDEFSVGWQTKKVRSKYYKSKTFVIEFKSDPASNKPFEVTGSWQ